MSLGGCDPTQAHGDNYMNRKFVDKETFFKIYSLEKKHLSSLSRFSYLAEKLFREIQKFLQNLPIDEDPFAIEVPERIFQIWAELREELRGRQFLEKDGFHINMEEIGLGRKEISLPHLWANIIEPGKALIFMAIVANFLETFYEEEI